MRENVISFIKNAYLFGISKILRTFAAPNKTLTVRNYI